jgi:hypothetical protein
MDYSAEWIKEQLAGKDWLPLRQCSLCSQTIGYIVENGRPYFSSACGCSSFDGGPRPSDWQDIADTLAMQSSDEIRDRIMATLKGERVPA